jgi:peptidoglycan hydrolase-like protein with peptidoglycan-binding domain
MARAKKVEDTTTTVTPVEITTVDIGTLPGLFPGVTGRAVYVRMLQEALTRKGFRCGVTGDYDANTTRAVQRMQTANKLLPDARVGAREWEALMR